MKYVQQQILEFSASNVIQDFPDYNPSTTYIYEDITTPTSSSVVRHEGYQWRSITDGNLGNTPSDTSAVWTKWKVSNTYAMLDQQSLTQTVQIGNDIIVEFERGRIDSIGLGYYTASEIIIEHLDKFDVVIPQVTQTIVTSGFEGIFNLADYINIPRQTSVNKSVYIAINPIGTKIRVTLKEEGSEGQAACGFLIGGAGIDMGATLNKVSFSFKSYSNVTTDSFGRTNIVKRNIQDLAKFRTIADRKTFSTYKRNIKEIYDEIVMFVLDPSESTDFENLITLAKVKSASISAEVADKNIIPWSIQESI